MVDKQSIPELSQIESDDDFDGENIKFEDEHEFFRYFYGDSLVFESIEHEICGYETVYAEIPAEEEIKIPENVWSPEVVTLATTHPSKASTNRWMRKFREYLPKIVGDMKPLDKDYQLCIAIKSGESLETVNAREILNLMDPEYWNFFRTDHTAGDTFDRHHYVKILVRAGTPVYEVEYYTDDALYLHFLSKAEVKQDTQGNYYI
jgi:hypothetical protein